MLSQNDKNTHQTKEKSSYDLVLTQAILLSSEGVAKRGYRIYESNIRQKVETEANIGKMVIINVKTDELCLPPEAVALLNLPFKSIFGIKENQNYLR